MDKIIVQSIPGMAQASERYKQLHKLDLILDGKFYDHLPTPFYAEYDSNGQYIPLYRRRPSAKFNICAMAANHIANKLFAGRYAPRLSHDDESVKMKIQALSEEARLETIILDAAFRGSVGSVAITFKVLRDEFGQARAVVEMHRAKNCVPSFDPLQRLVNLRVQYVTSGAELRATGLEYDRYDKPIQPTQGYWFVKDYTRKEEIQYFPIKEQDWSPDKVEQKEKLLRIEDPRYTMMHNLGFVPAQWFTNPGETETFADGPCLWEHAISMSIEIDYTMSSLGRGIRYNSSPQVVMNGQMVGSPDSRGAARPNNTGMGILSSLTGDSASITRSPSTIWQFPTTRKDSEGNQIEGGDAKLLEMDGGGIKVGLEYVDKLRNLSLEQIIASRKEPDKMSGAMSGRAMEYLNEEYAAVIQKLRTAWGKYGLLELLKKMALAAIAVKHQLMVGITPQQVDGLTLGWPEMFPPDTTEILSLVQAMVLASTPTTPAIPGTPAGIDGSGGTPEVAAGPILIDPEEAKAFLHAQIEFPIVSANRIDPVATTGTKKTKGSKKRKPAMPEDPTPPRPADGGHLPPATIQTGVQQ